MEGNELEPKDKQIDKDLAGDPTEVYSMRSTAHPDDQDSDLGTHEKNREYEREEKKEKEKAKHPEHKPEPKPDPKQEAAKKQRSIVINRMVVAFLILTMFGAGIYFIGKGINWGIKKIQGKTSAMNVVTPSLVSVADPNSAHPTEPVISNMNIYPGGQAPEVQTANGSTGGNSGAALANNNCPGYLANRYYYCEWLDKTNFRPYATKEEYDSAHTSGNATTTNTNYTNTNYTNTGYPYNQPYYPPTGGYSQPTNYPYYQVPPQTNNSGAIGPNGCPEYTGNQYAYCVWYDRTIFRGYRPGE